MKLSTRIEELETDIQIFRRKLEPKDYLYSDRIDYYNAEAALQCYGGFAARAKTIIRSTNHSEQNWRGREYTSAASPICVY